METISPSVRLLYYFYMDREHVLHHLVRERDVFDVYINSPQMHKEGHAGQEKICKSIVKEMIKCSRK